MNDVRYIQSWRGLYLWQTGQYQYEIEDRSGPGAAVVLARHTSFPKALAHFCDLRERAGYNQA